MSDYFLGKIDFSDIYVMDAGTGSGNTTLRLARKMAWESGTGKIISVDIDPDNFILVKKKLGELKKFVEFVKADLTCMPQIKDESFHFVVCTGTICAINDKPLKALRGLKEFYRILKKDGELIILEEYPLPKPTKPEEVVQVMRWQTYKSVSELIGEGHYTEIYPEELEFAASLIGFKSIEWRRLKGIPLKTTTMEDWKDFMIKLVNKEEDKKTRKAFLSLISRIHKKFKKQNSIHAPSYIMKMVK